MKNPARFGFALLLLVHAAGLAADDHGKFVEREAIPLFTFSGDSAARKAWVPMGATAPVSAEERGGEPSLKMACNFAGTKSERASWDRAVSLDLSLAASVRFQISCADTSPISHFTVYFASGEGWYSAGFSADSTSTWKQVEIGKAGTKIEGRPAGWGKIRTIRISAWRGKDVDTAFHLAGFAVVRPKSNLMVLRGESSVSRPESAWKEVRTFSSAMTDRLTRSGFSPLLVSDLDLPKVDLGPIELVVLPHNPHLRADAVSKLKGHLARGGKILSFYDLHPDLASVVGMKPGRYVRQKYGGYFSSLAVEESDLPGSPPRVEQRSWNIRTVFPVEGRSSVAARWLDEKDRPCGHPAILVSQSCVHMTHVFLPGGGEAKQMLLLAMVGRLVPGVWKRAARIGLENVGVFGPFSATLDGLRELAKSEGTREGRLLKDALASLEECMSLYKRASFHECVAVAGRVRKKLIHAYCATKKSLPGEHRAFWCHSPFGVQGMSWAEAVEALAVNGFTAVQPNMLWGGVAFFESEVLPVSPDVRTRGDQLKLCLDACKKHGVECHVWKVNWNMGRRTPRDFVDRMKSEGRTQVRFDGRGEPRWLCPSHPANQALEIEAMVEVAQKYDVQGIHFDYIRYPGIESCYCHGCRKRFEKIFDLTVENWPKDALNSPTLKEKWFAFRRNNITQVVEAVSRKARKARPGVRISAAVFRNWPSDRNNIGQDWKRWCDEGYLDFVCPMDYTEDTAEFEACVARQKGWAGSVACYPGIGLSCWSDRTDICRLIAQIEATRRNKTGGFTVFELGPRELKEVLPLCAEGITAKTK
jgi:uncharacterized lipoprotein YddW (UPF0748 family)